MYSISKQSQPPQDSSTSQTSQEKELEDRLEAINALKELVKKQRCTIESLKRRQRESKENNKDGNHDDKDDRGMIREISIPNNIDTSVPANDDTNDDAESLIKRRSVGEEQYELNDDIYSMIFLAKFGSRPFLFALSIFFLKVLLFSFIAVDLFRGETTFFDANSLVRAAQFFMLPVAVAIQEDLTNSYAAIANIKYDPVILTKCPGAHHYKFKLSFYLRLVDGLYSLVVNTILLLQSTEVLSLFLNFAALQFLQTIDDVAFGLAADGFLTDEIEKVVGDVKTTTLPQKTNKLVTSLDSILFLVTYGGLLAGWIYVTVNG